MAQLSDSIERFIKDMMEDGAQIEVRRNELAQHFGCAPSQINYVLATRFSVDHGYIRIVRIGVNSPENLLSALLQRIGNSIDEDSAVAIIQNLLDRRLVTLNEARIMRAAVAKNALALPVSAKDVLRASVLSGMVRQVFQIAEEGK